MILPTLAQLALDASIADIPPFLAYFPPLTVVGVFLGARWAAAVLITSAALANYLFMKPRFAWSLTPNDLLITSIFVLSGALVIATTQALRLAVRQLSEASARAEALNLELQHRLKNTLTVVQALASQTLRSTSDPADFYPAFRGRLLALSEAQRVLSTGDWSTCRMPDVAEGALRPFQGEGLFTLEGPPCRLPAASCVPLVMALHELGTNATKHGALSTPAGQVRLTWELCGATLKLTWQELFGPPVATPEKRGLGTRLLTQQGGLDEVHVHFRPEGVVCEIAINEVLPDPR